MTLNSFDSLFASDEKKATEGVPIPVGINAKGDTITIWVAESGNSKHEAVQRRYSKQLEATRKNKDAYNQILARIVAESVLIKWDGFLTETGEPVEPTTENKVQMLTKYRKFMNQVLEIATDADHFRVTDPEAEKESEKN